MRDSAMHRFGLIGYPLGHSFSQDYFTRKFEALGISARYDNFPLQDIGLLPELLATPHLRGLNVTIPHKEAVIPFLNDLSPAAEAIGAVNTILIHEGRTSGFNTDTFGCAHALLGWLDVNVRSALILGTGGAAKAVGHVLSKMGISCTCVSRTAREGVLVYEDLTPALCHKYQLIVNATPLGTAPQTDVSPPFPFDGLTPGHYVFDLVYNPEKTLFLNAAEAQGARIKNGLEMLHLQADRAWNIWKSHLDGAQRRS